MSKENMSKKNILDYDEEKTIRPQNFTLTAMKEFYDTIESDQFQGASEDTIYKYLTNIMEIVSFKDFLRRYIYEYDSKGNLLQETYISGDTDKESIEQKFEYKYDSLGRIQRKSKKAYLFDNWTYYDYLYNDDGTINKISISYSYKDDESELRYNYVWK